MRIETRVDANPTPITTPVNCEHLPLRRVRRRALSCAAETFVSVARGTLSQHSRLHPRDARDIAPPLETIEIEAHTLFT